jgi:hypothetical protein
MKKSLPVIVLAAFLLLAGKSALGESTADDFYAQWVDYRGGEISLDFDRTPVVFALHAIHAKTGFQIVIPSRNESRVVNFRLQRQPFEPAMRSLISTIGYENFAFLYDEVGRPSRAVVLSAQPVKAAEDTSKKEPSKQPLTAQEQEKLQQELARWRELKEDDRSRIETRLKDLPPSEEREKLVSEYGRQVLGLSK